MGWAFRGMARGHERKMSFTLTISLAERRAVRVRIIIQGLRKFCLGYVCVQRKNNFPHASGR
jgi:hypothetical protein